MIAFSFLIFVIACIFSFYIPGIVLLSFIQKDYTKGERFLIAWPLGVVTFLLISYIFAWIGNPFLALLFPILCSLYGLVFKREKIFYKFHSIDWLSVGIIILGTLSFSVLTFFSGVLTVNGFTFYDVNRIDGLVHLALIKNMLNTFPPGNPSLAGESLRGYHYFYDFLLSRFALFYHFLPRDLEFRFFPLFISTLFGISFFLFSTIYTKIFAAKRLILFFAYFGENIGFLYTLITAHSFFGDIGFPFTPQLLLDPSVVISIPLLLCGLFFLVDKRKTIKTAFISGMFLGVLSEVKVYAGLIGIGIVLLFAIYSLFREKQQWKWYGITIIVTGILTVVTFFPNNFGAGTLLFAPLLAYNHFISQQIFDNLKWQQLLQLYVSKNNIPRIIEKYIQAVALFWLLVLGIRVVGLISIQEMFHKSFWKKKEYVLLFLIFLVPLSLGSFFIQTVSVFDVVQFFWIAVALFSIPTGMAYYLILRMFPTVGRILILLLIFAVSTIPLSVVYYTTFFVSSADNYSAKQVQLLRLTGSSISPDSFIIVIPPYDATKLHSADNFQWYREPLVAAFTGRSTYYEPAIAYYHMYSSLYDTRQEDVYTLANDLENCATSKVHKLLHTIGTNYVISFNDYPCVAHTSETIKTKSADGIYFFQFR